MIQALITSKTRIKLLHKFFLNPKNSSYLRGLEAEFGDSTNAIRLELNRFEEAGLLTSYTEGNKKLFKANEDYPLFAEINSMVRKMLGLDVLADKVLHNLGHLEAAYLTGNLANGIDDHVMELVFIGTVDKNYLHKLVTRCEDLINRKIKYLVYGRQDFEASNVDVSQGLLLWKDGA